MENTKAVELLQEHVLCYVHGNRAVFTNIPLAYQWGDDWNDAPYEHNAGDPYEWSPHGSTKLPQYELKHLRFEVEMETPEEIANGNSAYSVEDINAGATAWLSRGRYNYDPSPPKPINAGVTIKEFKRLIWLNGGEVYEAIQHEEGY